MYVAQPQPMYGQQQPMMMQQQPVMMMQQQPMMMQQQPMMMQQQQPMMMQQQQPVYIQQQQQPVYIQQQPQQQVFVQQPQQQPMFVQQQPVVQVVGGGIGGIGGMPPPTGAVGPTSEAAKGDTAKLFEELKKTNSFKLRYMDANFRGDGGFTFAVYLRGSSSQLATVYTNKSGDITLETADKDNSFTIAQVSNNSASFYDPAKGSSSLAGQVAFAEGSCGSWSFNAEQSGQRLLALQNRQFNYCLACLCAPIYLGSYYCCNNKNTLQFVNGEGDRIGSANYNTDDIRSYREMEASFEDNGTAQSRMFAILTAIAYFHKRVGSSIDRLKGMNDVQVSFH